MFTKSELEKKFSYLGNDLVHEILKHSSITEFEAGTELVREGQFVKVVPLVLNGLVKVYTKTEEKELLLYHIKPDQSCIMSFSSAIQGDKSKIFALTEELTSVLLLPSDKLSKWIIEFPAINLLFYSQYDLRYNELIDSIHQLIYNKLDKRILDYLQTKSKLSGKHLLKLSHREIANDLGTAREVVSRLIKKMEQEKLLKQHHDQIEIL